MKPLMCGLALLAVAGAALAQEAGNGPVLQTSFTGPAVAAAGTCVVHTSAEVRCGPICNAPCHAPCNAPCNAPCHAPPQQTCVPEPDVRKVPHTCYSKLCVDFCVPKCAWLSCFNRCGICPECEHPRTRYILVKKVRIEERPTFKCVPGCAPACVGCPGGPVPPPEVLPPPAKK